MNLKYLFVSEILIIDFHRSDIYSIHPFVHSSQDNWYLLGYRYWDLEVAAFCY